MLKSIFPPLLSFSLLCGCSIVPERDPVPLYTLQAPQVVDIPGANSTASLLIDIPTSDASLNSPRIAADTGGYRRDYIANSQWTDKLPRLVQDILLQTFQNANKFQDVGRPSSGILSDYMLQSDLREFAAHYDTSGSAPKVVLNAYVRLMDMKNRSVEASHVFSSESQSPENNIESIVTTFNEQIQNMALEILKWALHTSQSAEHSKNPKSGAAELPHP